MQLHFLGTGSGMPSKKRNVSGLAVDVGRKTWLFDCGEATQHQILHTGIKPRKVSAIWISHLHGDHVFGLPGFLSSRSALEGKEALHLYGPKGLREWIETTFRLTGTFLGYKLHITEFKDGDTFEQDGHRVTVRRLEHRFPSFGFRVEAPEQKGRLLVERLRELGIPSGPLYREIKENPTFEYDSVVHASEAFLGESRRGDVLTVLGDTIYCANSVRLAEDADVLVHEATFRTAEAKLAKKYGHATVTDAVRVAREANVGRLIVTHVSARYQDVEQEFSDELEALCPGAVVATDFSVYRVGES